MQNWGDSLGSFTQSITQNILKVDSLQDTFNSANFSHLYINGSSLRDEMAAELSRIYKEAINAAESLANDTEQLFDANCDDTTSYTIGNCLFVYQPYLLYDKVCELIGCLFR